MVFRKLFKKLNKSGGSPKGSSVSNGSETPLEIPRETLSSAGKNVESSKEPLQEYTESIGTKPSPSTSSGSARPLSPNLIKHHRMSSVPTSFLRQRSDSNGGSKGHLRSSSQDPSLLIRDPSIPKELVPIITLIHAQQARIYYDGLLKYQSNIIESKLSGTEFSFWSPELQEPTYINIADLLFEYDPKQLTLKVILNNSKFFVFEFETKDSLNLFYSALLLSQFEYRQLQESFSGLLLSAKGALLSDIRTILAPENRYTKTEWCVLRFPFLNNKWIKCYVVVIPGEKTMLKSSSKEKPGKIEIYTSNKTTKKHLLATIINGRSCYSIYPERPEFIDDNALLHITGNVYINEDMLNSLLTNDQSIAKKSSTSSLGKFAMPKSPLQSKEPRSRSSSFNKNFHRSESSLSLKSETSSLSKKIRNANLIKTNLCLLIPETHPSVKKFDTMIRLLIPILNSFKLYGRPTKFLSQRNDKHSLLFGLPQLPHTEYLDGDTALKLVELNIQNSLNEMWDTDDWTQVFKEMILVKLTNGYKGSGNLFDVFREGLIYTKAQRSDDDIYLSDNELLEFIDMGPESNSIYSSPRSTFIDRSRSSSFTNGPVEMQSPSISGRLQSPAPSGQLEPSPMALSNSHEYRNLLSVTPSGSGSIAQAGRSPLLNEYYFDDSQNDDTLNHSFSNSQEEQVVA